jgi:serine/threonine protein kinase
VERLKVSPGQVLEGRFLILEQIGRGGMSTVFKAQDLRRDGAFVAVKVPLPQFSSGVGSWSMFQREAEIGSSLCHPAIVRFIPAEAGQHRGYVVTEYVPGTTLSDRVGKGRRLAEAEALRIMSRVCEAAAYLHAQQVVHYDLKPGNVMLREDGSVTLIDFGMAHRIVKGRFSLGGSTPAIASSDYVAPEQLQRVRGKPSVDIYALGAMLYELLTGHPPFEGDDPFVWASARQIGDPKAPRALNPSISEQTEEIVLRALRRNPADRYASAAELQADLDHPLEVLVSGLSERLVEVTRWRTRLRMMRFIVLATIMPLFIMAASFRLLWWYLARKP